MHKQTCIILMTHGKFCEAMVESAEMIVGKLEGVYSFPLLPGVTPERYMEQVLPILTENPDGVYILTDMQGGTPHNVACALSRQHRVEIFTGLNLTMLIAADELRQEKAGEAFARELVQTAANSIQRVANEREV